MNNIEHYRKLRGLSQGDLADMVLVKQPNISRIERNPVAADGVPLRLYRAIATALHVKLSDLFSEELSQAELGLVEAFRVSPDAQRRMMLALANEAKALALPSDQ